MLFRQIALLVTAQLALLGCTTPGGEPADVSALMDPEISVLDIIDGDTITIAGKSPGTTLNARLVGYDAPEIFDPNCPEELALGNAAARHLQSVLYAATRVDSQPQGIDRQQRVLLRLTVDGRALTDIMVSEGLAVVYSGGRRVDWCAILAAP